MCETQAWSYADSIPASLPEINKCSQGAPHVGNFLTGGGDGQMAVVHTLYEPRELPPSSSIATLLHKPTSSHLKGAVSIPAGGSAAGSLPSHCELLA